MQSNRTVGLVLLVLLAVAGFIGWQLLSTEDLPVVPNGTNQPAVATGTATAPEAATDSGALAPDSSTPKREAVATSNPAAANVPAIIGQVLGTDGRGAADVEITCQPGMAFGADIENIDFSDADAFDPASMMARMRDQASQRATYRTDAEGRFRVNCEGTSKNVRVSVLARGHLAIQRTLPRPTTADSDVGTLTLEAAAIVSGRVVDVNGKGIAGARVARVDGAEPAQASAFNFAWPGSDLLDTWRGDETSVTDETGRFELPHLKAGAFSLRASHNDYPTATRTGLMIEPGHLAADILITMPRSATIRGTVSDLPEDLTGLAVMAGQKPAASNDPTGGLMSMLGDASEMLDDMGMAFGERQCAINSDGTFVLRGLKAGNTYRVWVGQEGRGFAGSGVCSKRVEAMTDSVGVALQYEPGVRVTFTVTDAKSGAAIESLWVRDQLRGGGGIGDMMAFAPSTARQKPYPDGKVTVANLRPKPKQKLQLTINAIGYGSLERKDIELPEAGSLDLGTLQLEPKPVLKVTVLSAYQGEAIRGAQAKLSAEASGNRNRWAQFAGSGSDPQSGRTNDEGVCMLNALEDQSSVLKVTCRGFAPASVTVPRTGPEALAQTVRLVTGGTVTVTVLDPDKKPVQNANVEHRTPEGSTDRRRTDANGVASFANLTPDLHDFRLAATDNAMGIMMQWGGRGRGSEQAEEAWQSIEVLDQETAAVALEKSPAAVLTGMVRENGVPLAGASVSFQKGQATGTGNGIDEAALGQMMGVMGGRGSNRTKTDEEGLYRMQDLPSGDHSVRITHPDRAMPSTVLVTLRDGDNRFDIDLTMTTLRGVVVDAAGNPVPDATVTVAQQQADNGGEARQIMGMMGGMLGGMLAGSKQTTDASGAFELRGVAADVALEVRVAAKGLSPATATTTVALGQTKGPIQVTMQAAGRIEVTVAKSQMFAALQAKFVGANAEAVEPVMQMLRGKKAVLEGLRPGTWEVTFQSMGNRDQEAAPKRTVEVVAGQTASIEF